MDIGDFWRKGCMLWWGWEGWWWGVMPFFWDSGDWGMYVGVLIVEVGVAWLSDCWREGV